MKSSLPKMAFDNISRFAYYRHGVWLLNLDDGRFMNHSKYPNLGYDRKKDFCYALVDINAGEELTTDYSEFCEKSNDSVCTSCNLCK
jgi:uncharacterized protein